MKRLVTNVKESNTKINKKYILLFMAGVLSITSSACGAKDSEIIREGEVIDECGYAFEQMLIDDTNYSEIIEYEVQEGDNLSDIARKYNTSVDAIIELNQFKRPDLYLNKNSDMIFTGEILKIGISDTYEQDVVRKK